MRSGEAAAPSRTRMRARVSSHIFLMSSPLRPIMLPTFETGTISRNTQCPGHPGHFSTAGLTAVAASEGFTADGAAAEAVLIAA